MTDDAPTHHQCPGGAHPWVAEAAATIRFGVSYFPHPADWRFFIDSVQRRIACGFCYFLLNILDGDHETIELAATVLPAVS